MDDIHAVIMAGGRGTRFWPVSRKASPKQFVELLEGRTLLQATVARLEGLVPPARTLVVTGVDFAGTVRDQLPAIPPENILLEPSGRNTAACICWAAMEIRRRHGGAAVMAVLPSDHLVSDDEGFRSSIAAAAAAALDGWLVTVGIVPDRPATGYGYLEADPPEGGISRVARFVEKPDQATARAFLESGRFLWNAGMFVWRADSILDEIGRQLPALHSALAGMRTGSEADPAVYGRLESVSIDYGVMEKAGRVAVVRASFGWDDLGDWPAARRAGVSRGRCLVVDGHDCTAWTPGRLTVVMGLSGVSVVESGGVILVMSDESAQKLRDVVTGLEATDPDLV